MEDKSRLKEDIYIKGYTVKIELSKFNVWKMLK